MITRTVYQCEHCKRFRMKPKIYFSESRMVAHEILCFYNLDNRACPTCEHNIVDIEFHGKADNICRLNVPKTEKEGRGLTDTRCTIKTDCGCWEIRDDKRREDEDEL